jgi:hypothetical protein
MNLLYEARQRDKREAEISRVELNISSSDPHCTDPQYPVWVSTLNRNDFVINSITVNLSATQPDHSSKLYEGYVTSDRILKPADGYGACWRLDDYKLENGKISGFEPKALDWEGSVSRIQKSD